MRTLFCSRKRPGETANSFFSHLHLFYIFIMYIRRSTKTAREYVFMWVHSSSKPNCRATLYFINRRVVFARSVRVEFVDCLRSWKYKVLEPAILFRLPRRSSFPLQMCCSCKRVVFVCLMRRFLFIFNTCLIEFLFALTSSKLLRCSLCYSSSSTSALFLKRLFFSFILLAYDFQYRQSLTTQCAPYKCFYGLIYGSDV